MVEYKELKHRCLLYHWLDEDECQLLVLIQNGTYTADEVQCREDNCPICELGRMNDGA